MPSAIRAPTHGTPARLVALLGVVALVPIADAAFPVATASAADPLPRVRIAVPRGIPDEPKVGGRITITVDGRRRHRSRIGIERRGQSSQSFPKKSYALETRSADGDGRDMGLLGMPPDDDWVLYAPYSDKALMRNVLAYETARALGRHASRTRWVELWRNGRYQGVYVLMQRLELGPGRVELDEPANLMEWTFDFQARRKGSFFRLPVTRRPILFEDPDRGDLSPSRRAETQASLRRAERSLYGPGFRDRAHGWRAHIDEAAAVDYLILQELFKNEDAFHASTYLSRARGGLWQLGPVWDFDIAMGNSDYGPSRFVTGSVAARRDWAQRLYRDAAFRSAMAARWRELRAGGLRRDLLASLDRTAARLVHTGAAGRNFRRWPVLGRYVWPNAAGHRWRRTYTSEVRMLRGWLVRRIAWLDANVEDVRGRR